MVWKRSWADCIFSAVILLCIVLGLFRCLYDVTGFDDAKIIFQELLAVFVPFAVLCSFLFYSKKSICIGLPLLFLVLIFCLGSYREPLLVWMKYTASHAVSAANDYYGLHLKTLAGQDSFPVKSFQRGNAVICLLVTFLLSIDVAGFQKAARVSVLSFSVFIFGMCVGKIPSCFDLLLLFTGLLGLAAMGKQTSGFHKKWKCGKNMAIKIICEEQEEEKEAVLHGGSLASAVTLCCFLLALGLGSLFGKQISSRLLELHAPVQNQINAIEYQLLHYDYSWLFEKVSKYLSFGRDGRKQDQGELSNSGVNHTGEEILKITLQKKPMEAIYLRGFIGKDYEGDRWTEAEESDFSDQVQEWDLEDKENAGLSIQNFAFTGISSQFEFPSDIKISYGSNAGTYAYLPYLSKAGGSLTISGDGAVFRTAEKKNKLVKTLYTAGFYKYARSYYQSMIKEDALSEQSALEEQYRQYVKEEYLTVPDHLKKLKKECRKNIHAQNLWAMTTTIQEYIQENAQYSLELDPLPAGEDFAEYFLYTQKKGYCIHFATAAVLMYRICKVPSRFVEGYVVWPKDFVENGDGTYTAAVTDERAHAWAEIYYDGVGFMPVDVTPTAARDQMMAADTQEQKEDGGETGQDNNSEENSEENNQENNEESSGENKKENSTQTDADEEKDSTGRTSLEEQEKNAQEAGEKTPDADDGKEAGDGSGTGNGTDPGTGKASEGETSTGTGGTAFVWNRKTFVTAAACLMAVFLLLTAGKLVPSKRKYRKEWKRQSRSFQDEKRREVIKLSCKLYAGMEMAGYEKKWRKKCKGSLTDREYKVMIRKEFSFLNDEYEEFQKVVQKARFDSPEAENIISETELMQCRKFVGMIWDALIEKVGWHKRLLLKLLFPSRGMGRQGSA